MIVAVVGPTGVGKTTLSLSLARHLNAEIINADAVQVFKELNIGTAKITKEEMNGITHHMIDFLDPNKDYSVADYQKEARTILDRLISDNKNVVIVGGTGLYLKALLYDYKFSSETIKNDYEELSNEELKREVDKKENNEIHTNNRKRLIRFLQKLDNKEEVNIKSEKLYDFTTVGLTTDRNTLYNKINDRVDNMFENGLLEEAKSLYDKGIKRCNSVIGYKELYSYFINEITLEEAKELIKRNTRRYAKRQYTWFNNQMDVKWFNVDFENFNNTINDVITYLKKN